MKLSRAIMLWFMKPLLARVNCSDCKFAPKASLGNFQPPGANSVTPTDTCPDGRLTRGA